MDFLNKELEEYIEHHSTKENDLLSELNRETWAKVLMPRMLSGHIQGRVLSLLSNLTKPSNIIEIGTYTGYSALCLAEGIQEDGVLVTIDKDKELFEKVNSFFKKSNLEKNIIQKLGIALDVIPTLDLKYDLVFIDADKKNYINYFDMVLPLVNVGGIIIVDNVLWSGKVTEPDKYQNDKIAVYMNEFNKYIHSQKNISNLILPIRDGLTLITKNEN